MIVEAFDTEDGLRDSVTLTVDVEDCTTEDPDDEDDEDEDEDTETLTGGKYFRSRQYEQPTQDDTDTDTDTLLQHLAAAAQNMDTSIYTCADEIAPAYAYAQEK